MSRRRPDDEMAARGLLPLRSRDAVLRGMDSVNGILARKPLLAAGPDEAIGIADEAQAYVSRAALKLPHALGHFGIAGD